MTLRVKDLRYAYKRKAVLKGIHFSADAGELVCVLGENGAGKTTLFRCLLGFLNGYHGDIFIDGINAEHLTVRQTAERIAYIPQAHMPVFHYSVFEMVLMGTNTLTKGFGTPGHLERETARDMLARMNITHLSERSYAEISGGERQLALIARALAQKSQILVMDEPTANLDYGNQFRVMRQVKALAKDGYLVILSTHNPEHALLFGDKALVLKDGIAEWCGEPDAVLTPQVIESVYGVSVDIQTIQTPQGDVPVFVPCLGQDQKDPQRAF